MGLLYARRQQKRGATLKLTLTDKAGCLLLLTTEVQSYKFEAVTCSPHAEGFTVLNSLGITSMSKAPLEAACTESTLRREVCVLPVAASPRWRVLLTPTLRSLEPRSRVEAFRLMNYLFHASQASKVQANSLLITHFAHARTYPEVHVLGILDALKGLANNSYGRLKVLGIEFRTEHLKQFEICAREAAASGRSC